MPTSASRWRSLPACGTCPGHVMDMCWTCRGGGACPPAGHVPHVWGGGGGGAVGGGGTWTCRGRVTAARDRGRARRGLQISATLPPVSRKSRGVGASMRWSTPSTRRSTAVMCSLAWPQTQCHHSLAEGRQRRHAPAAPLSGQRSRRRRRGRRARRGRLRQLRRRGRRRRRRRRRGQGRRQR